MSILFRTQDSIATEAPAKYHDNTIILMTNLAALRIREIWWQDFILWCA